MKLLIAGVLIILTTSLSFSQENSIKSTFKDIEYVQDVKLYNDDVYCAGITFQTIINDGNASDSYLVNYDKNSLKLKWSLKISDEHSNRISSIIRYKDKIYALVTQGKILPSTKDVHLNLLVISLKGEIEETISFGNSFHDPSDIVVNDNKLIFGYQAGNNITYTNNDLKSIIVTYDLATKKQTKLTSSDYFSRPKKLLINNSDIYLFGIYIHPGQPSFPFYKKGLLSKTYLNSTKTEYFLDSYIKDKTLTIVCAFPGVYGDTQKYMKFYYINTETNKTTSLTIPYKDMGLSDVKFNTFSTGSSTWVVVEDMNSKLLKYVLLDNKGKIIDTRNFGNGKIYTQPFIIDGNIILTTAQGEITITKI